MLRWQYLQRHAGLQEGDLQLPHPQRMLHLIPVHLHLQRSDRSICCSNLQHPRRVHEQLPSYVREFLPRARYRMWHGKLSNCDLPVTT